MPKNHAVVVRELVVPTIHEKRVVSILGVGNKPTDYDEKEVGLVSYIADVAWTIVVQKRADEQIHRLNSQLSRLAMTDELTGLANRRSFFIQGKEEIKRARRFETPLTMIMLDINRFKIINDTYGHDAGDTVLQCIARTLQEGIREVDVAARLCGEEFGILLPHTKTEDAVVLAERLRIAIEAESCSGLYKKISVTASVGVAPYSMDMPHLDTLLRKSDVAMYQAKHEGRNRVVCWT
jgi:diguanylate cyclase (GGDEF)-like protein